MPALRIPGKLNLDYCFCYPPLPPTRCVWGGCRRNQWLTFPLGCYRGRFSLLGRLQLPGAAPELHPMTHSQPPGHSPLGLTGQLTPGQGGSLPQRLGLPCHPRGKLSTRYAVVYTGVSGPSRGPWMWYVGEIVPDLGVDFMIGVRLMELIGSVTDHGIAKIYARNVDITFPYMDYQLLW